MHRSAKIINIIEKQAQEDNIPMGIKFKPEDFQNNNLRLAGVDELNKNIHEDNLINLTFDEKMDIKKYTKF